ncbi:MAG: DEAD/DEAH box helicase [Planctomycetes bacterium]|nr:DEAD/DEAH box helicase [Planctomycetota bacterium]
MPRSLPGRRPDPGRQPPVDEVLGAWVLTRDKPFTEAEARAAVAERYGYSPAVDLGDLLRAHPQLAEHEGVFFSPRIVAERFSFVVRLRPNERNSRPFVLGHRFLPFVDFDQATANLILSLDDKTLCPETVHFRLDKASLGLFSLLPSPVPPGWEPRNPCFPRDPVRVYRLPPEFLNPSEEEAELVVRCLDYSQRRYRIGRLVEAAPPLRAADDRRLAEALRAVCSATAPGPTTAARQMLQTLARCYARLSGLPIGPLAPLFCSLPGLELDKPGRRPRFLPTPLPPSSPYPSESDLGGVVRAVDEALRAIGKRHSAAFDPASAALRELTWDGLGLAFRASVFTPPYAFCDVTIRLRPRQHAVEAGCSCEPEATPASCRHSLATLRALSDLLRDPRQAVTVQVRDTLALPSWKRSLALLDSLLSAVTPSSAAGAGPVSRLAWRLEGEGPAQALSPQLQKRRKSGSWTGGRPLSLELVQDRREEWIQPVDRQAARLGASCANRQPYSSALPLHPDPHDAFDALESLVGHPLVVRGWGGECRPVVITGGAVRLRVEKRPSGESTLVPELDRRPILLKPQALHAQGIVVFEEETNRLIVARTGADLRNVVAGLLEEAPVFPPEAAEELLARIPRLEALCPVELPSEVAGEEVPADGRIRLLLAAEAGLAVELRVRPVPGSSLVFEPGEGPDLTAALVGGKLLRARRARVREVALAEEIARELKLAPPAGPGCWSLQMPLDNATLDLVLALQANTRAELVVEWPEEVRRRWQIAHDAGPKDLSVWIEDRKDWFGVDGEILLDGSRVPLAAVLEALRAGRRYVPIAAGKWTRLSALLEERLRDLADVAHADRGGLEVGAAAAPFVQELLREAGTIKACAAWKRMEERFRAAMAHASEPPATLAAELRDYQVEGYRWLSRLSAWGVGCCLADDMGLGKTVQALAVLLDRAAGGPALVIAPTSVASNWVREARRFAPTLNPILYRETERMPADGVYRAGDLVVLSYGLLLRDIAKLERVRWGTLVLDEAQFVKNSQSKTAAAARRLVADWRLALTGTPMENRLGELWSLFRATSPGLFGSWERFRERFVVPIEEEKSASRRHALARLVRPFILRRNKGEVLEELPPRTEIRLTAELSAEERKLYDDTRLSLLTKLLEGGGGAAGAGGETRRFHVLAALTTLRQLACHPKLVRPGWTAGSAKLRVLLETVEELREGKHRALVFSQFVRHLDLVRKELDARGVQYEYLDGSTPAKERDRAVDAFQRGEGELFLISLKAGGTGLNLTAADYAIHLDPWWNPAVEDQATGRAHRLGQTRPVTVYRIVSSGTIEEEILALHADKRDLVAGVLEGTDRAAKLSTEDLIGLIRGGGRAEGAAAAGDETEAG